MPSTLSYQVKRLEAVAAEAGGAAAEALRMELEQVRGRGRGEDRVERGWRRTLALSLMELGVGIPNSSKEEE